MKNRHRILAVGAAHWDILGRADMDMKLQDDRPGRIYKTLGGVAGPIAVKLARLGAPVSLFAYIGREELGDALLALLHDYGVNCSNVTRGADETDVYLGIEAKNGLIAAISDARNLEKYSDEILAAVMKSATTDQPVIVDGNIRKDSLEALAKNDAFAPDWFCLVPASPGKIDRLKPFLGKKQAHYYLNLEEANLLCDGNYHDARDAALAVYERGAQAVLVSNGGNPCAYVTKNSHLEHQPPEIEVRRVTGAGDTLTAHHIYARMSAISDADALPFALEAVAKFMSKEDDRND